MQTLASKKLIGIRFNIAVFTFVNLMGFISFAFSDKAKGIPPQGIVMTSLVDLVRVVVVLFVTAYFVEAIWNRFLSDVFDIRSINRQEAIAIILMLSLIHL